MMRYGAILCGLTLIAGCGGSPTGPSPRPRPSPAPPSSPSIAVSDTITGASVGGFARTVSGTRATVSAAGYVTRELSASVTQIDLIPLAGFDLGFYRQFVRGAGSGRLDHLRRLTASPRIYIRTLDDHGAPVDTSVVNGVERIIQTSGIIDAFTGGRLHLAGIEAGPSSREGVPGWITIRWSSADPAVAGCGHAPVAGGWIELTNHPRCGCPGTLNTYPRVVKHEIGHALGYWHTDDPNDVMFAMSTRDCDNNPSPRERHHAAIAYSRPIGNRDIDIDP